MSKNILSEALDVLEHRQPSITRTEAVAAAMAAVHEVIVAAREEAMPDEAPTGSPDREAATPPSRIQVVSHSGRAARATAPGVRRVGHRPGAGPGEIGELS